IGNLIENARRYGRSPADDRAHINLSARQEGSIVAIEVRDKGSGIAPTDVHRLLRPFSRGEPARTGVSGGGLGLAIVERLLGQVDGTLELISQPAGGLVARIELPKVRGKEASSTRPGPKA